MDLPKVPASVAELAIKLISAGVELYRSQGDSDAELKAMQDAADLLVDEIQRRACGEP